MIMSEESQTGIDSKLDKSSSASNETGAFRLMESLGQVEGLEYIFLNSGTDHAPIIEAISKLHLDGKDKMRVITVPHEIPAVSMAHGFYLVSGKPQVVMVHTLPGTANSVGGLLNASSARIPIILMAGRTPIREDDVEGGKTRSIHWNQELRDQAGIVRQFVKWDWEHKSNSQISSVVERAFEIAMSEPKGPVYLTFPRELLCEPAGEGPTEVRLHLTSSTMPDYSFIEQTAKLLIEAKRPLIITDNLGRNTQTVRDLVALAEMLSIPVIQDFHTLSFPTNHALYAGSLGSKYSRKYIESADTIFIIDVDIPWIPENVKPRSDAKLVQLDEDPTHQTIPFWGFRMDLRMKGSSSVTIPALVSIISKMLGGNKSLVSRNTLQERWDATRQHHYAMKQESDRVISQCKNDKPIDPRWLSYCLGQAADGDTIMFNETATSPFFDYIETAESGSVFRNPQSGVLGWAIGAALGARLANPNKVVYALCGDGAYMYCVPTACHYVSMAYDLPIITVVFNNQCWNASKRAVQELYPTGYAVKSDYFPGCELKPAPKFELVAKSSGAYAVTIENPEDVAPSLSKAKDIVKKKRQQVLLDVIMKSPI